MSYVGERLKERNSGKLDKRAHIPKFKLELVEFEPSFY
jgi:hypothetical protein